MLFHIPTHRELPQLREILANLGNPSSRAIAQALGLSERSIRAYRKRGSAPRPVMIALFWVTTWGHARINVDMHNECTQAHQLARALRSENETLKLMVEQLAKHRNDRCANDPITRDGVTLRARALLLRNGASSESPPIRVTIPHAWRRNDQTR